MFPNGIGRTIVNLLIVSLIVGLVLSLLDVTPRQLFENFGDTARAAYDLVAGFFLWAGPFVVIGAVVVLPIWAFAQLLRFLRGRRG